MVHLHVAPGGVLDRIERRAHFERLRSQMLATLAIGWLPLVLLCAVEWAITGRADPLLLDLSVHARLLLAAPLLLAASSVLTFQCREALDRLFEENLAPQPELDRLVAVGNRLGNALWPDVVIVLVAIAMGVASLAGWMRPAVRLEPEGMIAGRLWLSAVALPLFRFLLWRALWLWLIWAGMLVRLSKMDLRHQPGHPDRRGGLAFLTFPALSFHAIFLFAVSCIIAGRWGTDMLSRGAHVLEFKNLFFAYVVVAELLAFAPLLVFTPKLFFAGRAGQREFGALSTDYTRRFRRRWTLGPHDDPLGTPDIQSLNDLAGVYRESVEKNSPLLFLPRDLIALLVVMVLPMVPLILMEIPIETLLPKLGSLVLGGH